MSDDRLTWCHKFHCRSKNVCMSADSYLHEVDGREISNSSIRKSLQIALNLAHDDQLRDGFLYHELYPLVMCPWCHLEGEISDEAAEILTDRSKRSGGRYP